MQKKIIVISSVLLVLGIASYIFNLPSGLSFIYYFRLFDFANVEFINDISSSTDTLGMLFYGMFFIGILAYGVSKFRETRLLRFIYSVILFSKLILLPIWVYQLYLFIAEPRPEFAENDSINTNWIYPYIAVQVLLIIISFFFLKYFTTNKELVYEDKVYGESISKIYLPATKSQRLLNYSIDIVVMVLVFSNLISFLARTDFFNNGSSGSSNNSQLIALMYIVLFRTIYYLFFEGIFRATPGKFLSETRVMDYEGDPTGFKGVFTRTICRSVPFDSITFLFSFNLHDNWSETAVFQEKRTGVSGVKYMQYFISVVLVLVVLYFGFSKYYEIKRENHLSEVYEEEQKTNKDNLKNIAPNDLMLIVDCEEYSYNRFLAKVQKVNANKVYCRVVNANDQYVNEESLHIEDSLYKNKGRDMVFDKTLLFNSLPPLTRNDDFEDKKHCKNLFNDGKLYTVEKIVCASRPLFSVNTNSYKTINKKITELTLTLVNMGAEVKLISIKSNDDVTWSPLGEDFPVTVQNGARHDYDYRTVVLVGSGDNIKKYDFTMLVEDTQGKKHNYQVTSFDEDEGVLIKKID